MIQGQSFFHPCCGQELGVCSNCGFRVRYITVVSKRLEPSRTSRYICPPFLTTIMSQELMQRGAAMSAPSARSVVKMEPGLQPPAIFAITGSSEAAR